MTGRIVLIALLASLAAPASAQQPSFDCRRAGTPTEHAICGSDRLSRLDVQMARLYRAAARRAGGNARRLRAQQLVWQQWRNICGGDTACLARRYAERIVDFDPGAMPTAPAGPAQGVRRLRNGRWEEVMPDGTIRWTSVGGGGAGTIHPDGTETVMQFVTVDNLPGEIPPPSGGALWFQTVEGQLVGVVRGFLPPEDHAAYDALHAAYPPPQRVFRHIRAIKALGR